MPLYPCAFAVQVGPMDVNLFACCVEAMNRDEADGKARRIAATLWPGMRVGIKVNGHARPIEPGRCELTTPPELN